MHRKPVESGRIGTRRRAGGSGPGVPRIPLRYGHRRPGIIPNRQAARISPWFPSVRKLVRRAGLPESYRLYDCRHTAGAAFTMAGVDTTTAMRILGHSTVQAHQRYIHVSAEYMEKVMSRVRAIYGLDGCREGEPDGGRE